MVVNPFILLTYYKRSAKRVYRKFYVNRLELEALIYVYTYLNVNKKTIASVNLILDEVTTRGQNKARLRTHLWHCVNKKLLGSYEYVRKPDSLCVGFTDYGLEVVKAFEAEVKEFHDKPAKVFRVEPPKVTPESAKSYRLRPVA